MVEQAKQIISDATPITLRLGMIAAVVAFTFYAGGAVKDLTHSIESLQTQSQLHTASLAKLAENIDDAAASRWTYNMMEGWVEMLKKLNPDVKFPPLPIRIN